MDMDAWLVRFRERSSRVALSEVEAERERIAERIRVKRVADSSKFETVVRECVVLETGRDIGEGDKESAQSGARRLGTLGVSLGWHVQYVRSVAADSRKGLIVAVSLRLARHDERAWAMWVNGRFDGAWYWHRGVGGPERLGVARMGGTRAVTRRGIADAIEGVRGNVGLDRCGEMS